MYSTWRWIHKRFACFLLKYSFHDYIRLLKWFCFILSMNCSENELKRSVALKTRIKSIGELIIDDIQGAHCFEVFLWYLRNGHWSVPPNQRVLRWNQIGRFETGLGRASSKPDLSFHIYGQKRSNHNREKPKLDSPGELCAEKEIHHHIYSVLSMQSIKWTKQIELHIIIEMGVSSFYALI